MSNGNDKLKLYVNIQKSILIQYRVVLFLAVIEGVIPIFTVYFSKIIIQGLLEYQSFSFLLGLTAVVSFSYFVDKFCVLYRSQMIKYKLTRTKNDYLRELVKAYCKSSLSFAELENNIKAKEAALNAIDFNDSIRNYLEVSCKLISGIISFIGSMYIVFSLNYFLIIIVLLVFVPEYVLNAKKKKIDYANMHKWIELNRKTNCYSSLMTEVKTIKELKVFQAEGLVYDSIAENDRERTREMISQEMKHSFLDMVYFFFKTLGDGFIYCYLVLKLWEKEIQIPQFTFYIGGISTLSLSINKLSEAYISMKQYRAYLFEYVHFMESANYFKNEEFQCAKPENCVKKIEFENVSFVYPGQEQYVLKNISTVIYPNRSISIVGRNGAGKSTFIKLLLGLYKPTEGKILINDKDINTYAVTELNAFFSALFQDYHLFPITIYENVTLEEKTGKEDLTSLYGLVGMDERISDLPFADDTVLSTEFDKDGVDLSGGQKLKLAIARTIKENCPFLVLDEPSAALDPKAEFEFYQMISKMNKMKTIIFVSHRMMSSKFCDRILVFDNGQIVGDGNHNDLYKSCEQYACLVDAQRYE